MLRPRLCMQKLFQGGPQLLTWSLGKRGTLHSVVGQRVTCVLLLL